jgi:hypothetical protein
LLLSSYDKIVPPKPTAQPFFPVKKIRSSLCFAFEATTVQTFPAVAVRRIVPASPIAQPSAVLLKKTSVKSLATFVFCSRQVYPPLMV